MQAKAQVHLLEVSITREDVANAEVLHDDHAGEIDEGDIRLVVIALTQFPSAAKLGRGNVDQQMRAGVGPSREVR
jgi:hypothetical protein